MDEAGTKSTSSPTKKALEHLKTYATEMLKDVNIYLHLKKRNRTDESIKTKMGIDDNTQFEKIKKYSKGPLEALKKAAGQGIPPSIPTSIPPITDYTKIMPTKLLRAYIGQQSLPSLSQLQTVFDFFPTDVRDDFLTHNEAKKDFHDSLMVMDKIGEEDNNFSTTNFSDKYREEWSDSSFDYDETKFIPITKKGCRIFFSDILTTAAYAFEQYYNEKDGKSTVTLNSEEVPDIPLYFVSLCQKRKTNSPNDYYTIWNKAVGKVQEITIDENGALSDIEMPTLPEQSQPNWKKKDWEKWLNEDENNKIPNIVKYQIETKSGDTRSFKFFAYHANIVFFYGGVLYSLGYGLHQDDKYKEAHPYLAAAESTVKSFLPGVFDSVDLFGAGTIYSRDDIDLETDAYNYKIVDIGIIDKKMVYNINCIFARITQLDLQTYITPPPAGSPAEYGLQYYEIAGDTDLIYSRLSNKYSPIFKIDYLNCTSFVEIVVGSRINCGNLYSDPNNCSNNILGDLDSNKIQAIMDAYFKSTTTVSEFTDLVKYNPRNEFDMEV